MSDFTDMEQILNIGRLRERCTMLSDVFLKATRYSSSNIPLSMNSLAWLYVSIPLLSCVARHLHNLTC